MSFDLSAISRSKSELRQKLAARPIEEKLALLDMLRERTIALRSASSKRAVVAYLAATDEGLKGK